VVSLRLEAGPALRHLQVYTPPGQDFFCVEPVSHMPDAINHPGHPMRVLAPGESFTAEIALHVRQHAERLAGSR
jgi:aldose 1-epimerase